MKIEYSNLYTHFIFTTLHRYPLILEKHRERIEKYITGIVNNNECQLYAIYANPEHVHFLASRSTRVPEESLALLLPRVQKNLLIKINFVVRHLLGKKRHQLFQYPSRMWIEFASIFLTSLNTIEKLVLLRNMKRS